MINLDRTVCAQILDCVPWRKFQQCVDRYHGDKHVHSFDTNEFFRVMLFAQLASRESLGDIVNCLNAIPSRLYHIGTKSGVKMHTMINLRGKIPEFMSITTAKTGDVVIMDDINWVSGGWYVMDRGYLDFGRTILKSLRRRLPWCTKIDGM